MSTNELTGVNLSTLAAGLLMPLQNNTNVPSLPGGCIPSTAFYTQISVCTTTQATISLPINPILGQTYTIRNDGAAPCFVCAGSTTSTINGLSVSTTAASVVAGAVQIPEGGGEVSFIASSNNFAANTAAVTAPLNNPLVVWQSTGGASLSSVFLATAATAFTISPTQTGTIFMLPANGATITLPAVANAKGCTYKFVLSASYATAVWTIAAPANKMAGQCLTGPNAGVTSTAATTSTNIVFGAASVIGDTATLVCDGTFYYATGISGSNTAAGSVTFS